jgi:DNA-binding NtrC family response regulator
MRQTPYSAALVDIRLPDLDGYEIFHRLHEIQPQTPVILMTGFGYDPTHSIVKARQEGLQTVLYKPFRSDRLMEAVEQALRVASAGSAAHGSAPEDAAHKSAPPPSAAPVPSAAADAAGEQGQPGAPSASADTDGLHEESRSTEVLRHEP